MTEENEIEAKKPSPTTDFLPSDGASCSLLVWTPNPENPREILGRSKRAPGITLYIIELMETRNDRGRMLGAFMSDELEREGLYDKALVHWLKWEAESQMREFMEIHSANASLSHGDESER